MSESDASSTTTAPEELASEELRTLTSLDKAQQTRVVDGWIAASEQSLEQPALLLHSSIDSRKNDPQNSSAWFIMNELNVSCGDDPWTMLIQGQTFQPFVSNAGDANYAKKFCSNATREQWASLAARQRLIIKNDGEGAEIHDDEIYYDARESHDAQPHAKRPPLNFATQTSNFVLPGSDTITMPVSQYTNRHFPEWMKVSLPNPNFVSSESLGHSNVRIMAHMAQQQQAGLTLSGAAVARLFWLFGSDSDKFKLWMTKDCTFGVDEEQLKVTHGAKSMNFDVKDGRDNNGHRSIVMKYAPPIE